MSFGILAQMIPKHGPAGIVVDTNLLLLYFIGGYDKNRIERFKRTETYSPLDYDLLEKLLSRFAAIITTPTILAEVNSLSGQLGEPAKESYYRHFGAALTVLDERYSASSELAASENWHPFGLTDCAIIRLARAGKLILTDDLRLWVLLEMNKLDALNFSHLRTPYWQAAEA